MKVGIVGLGWVGTSVASSILHRGIVKELLLNDVRPGLAEGEAMDLSHGSSFYPSAEVKAAPLEAFKDTDAVVIAAGRGGAPGESRLALLADNAAIARSIASTLVGYQGLIIVVSNPVDVFTRVVAEESGLPPSRVLGTGTLLDTARLKDVLGDALNVDPRSIHGQVVGEHGDSEVVLWSSARVGGLSLSKWPGFDVARQPDIATQVRSAAYEIIKRKGATNHAIGLVTAHLIEMAFRDTRRVITISRIQEGFDTPVALSLPTIVGRDGGTQVVMPDMNDEERAALNRSAEVLQKAYEEIEAKS